MSQYYTNMARIDMNHADMNRRALLQGAAAFGIAAGVGTLFPSAASAQEADVNKLVLETVRGPASGKDIQKVLAHEHLFVDFLGPKDPGYMDVNWADAIGASVNAATEVKEQGVNLLIEWGCMGVGRNIHLLRDVSRSTAVNIVCPTGIYKSLIPPQFEGMSSERIAEHFIGELTKGIDGTPVRAGFIKIATTEAGPTETDTMIHRAAAIAAKETGATMALHCPHADALKTVIATVEKEGVKLDRFVWGHAQPSSVEDHKMLAGRGATIQYDAISADSDPFFNGPTDDESMLDRIEAMVKAGFEKQVIVSTDASVFVNPAKWQYDRDSTYLHRYFAPKLVARLGDAVANQILRDNIIRAFRRGDKVV